MDLWFLDNDREEKQPVSSSTLDSSPKVIVKTNMCSIEEMKTKLNNCDSTDCQNIKSNLDKLITVPEPHKTQIEALLWRYSFLSGNPSKESILIAKLLLDIQNLEKKFEKDTKEVEQTSKKDRKDVSNFITSTINYIKWVKFSDKSINTLNNEEKSLVNDIQSIEIWDISDNLWDVISWLKEKLKDNNLNIEQKQLLSYLIDKLSIDPISEIKKLDDEFNKSIEKIINAKFPATIKLFWNDIQFENKKQALNAVKLIKNQVKIEITTWLVLVKEIALDILSVPLIPLKILASEWEDALEHWLEWEYTKILYADILPWSLGFFITANLWIFISTALLQSWWKLIKDSAGRIWMWLMEDYSRRWNLQMIDPQKNPEILEYYQRESIISWLRVNIEWLSDPELRKELLSDINNLEKYKLIKWTDTFYYKAYLIWNRIWLKNFVNPKYLWIRFIWLFVDWWKLIYPDIKNEKFFNKFKPVLSKEWISFSKQYFTPEINKVIEKWLEEFKKWAREIFSEVNVTWDVNSRKIEFEVKNEWDWKSIKTIRHYLKWLRNITEEERTRREQLLDRYKDWKKTNPLLRVDKVQNDLCKIAELWLVDNKEFISQVEKEFKDIFEKKLFLKDYLTWSDSKILLQDIKWSVPFLNYEWKLLYELINTYKTGKLEVNLQELKTLIDWIKKWRIKTIAPVSVTPQNINQIFEIWEKLEKQFNEWKNIILWKEWNKLVENLSHVIDLDKDRFDESSQEVQEKILEELKNRVEKWSINITWDEAKVELIKLYNRILPNFVVIDIIKWKNQYLTWLESLNTKDPKVKEFLVLVETWKWFWSIDDLKYVIDELKGNKSIKERKLYYDMSNDIKTFYKDWELLYDKIKESIKKWLGLPPSLEITFEKVIDDIKSKVDNNVFDKNSDEFKRELSKLLKWILPKYVLLDIVKWINTYWIDLWWNFDLNNNKVKEFIKLIDEWKYHWNIEDIKYAFRHLWESTKNYMLEKIRVFSVSNDIREINENWPKLFESSFKNPKYGLVFDKDNKLVIDEFKNLEIELARFYHKMKWKSLSDHNINSFLTDVINKRKIDYSSMDFFHSVLNEIWLLDIIKANPTSTRLDVAKKISLICEKEIKRLLNDYDKKSFEEKEKVITELKINLWISAENKNSTFIDAMNKAWVNLWYIVDLINIFEEERKELKESEWKKIKEAKWMIISLDKEILELENYIKSNSIKNIEEYNLAKKDLLNRWIILDSILPDKPNFYDLVSDKVNKKISELNNKKLIEFWVIYWSIDNIPIQDYLKIYWSIDKIPANIIDWNIELKKYLNRILYSRLSLINIEHKLIIEISKYGIEEKINLLKLWESMLNAKEKVERKAEEIKKASKPK